MRTGGTEFHLNEDQIAAFCRHWGEDPESVGQDEFDTVQLHLLACRTCQEIAKQYEDQAAADFPGPVAEPAQPGEAEILRAEVAQFAQKVAIIRGPPAEERTGNSDVLRAFRDEFQPAAFRLAHALIQYLPDDAPVVAKVIYTEAGREIEWRDAELLLAPATAENSRERLNEIRTVLERLLEYLP